MVNGLSKRYGRELNAAFLVSNRRFPLSSGGAAYISLKMGELLSSSSATPQGLASHQLMPGSTEHARVVDEAVRQHTEAGLTIPRRRVVQGMQFGHRVDTLVGLQSLIGGATGRKYDRITAPQIDAEVLAALSRSGRLYRAIGFAGIASAATMGDMVDPKAPDTQLAADYKAALRGQTSDNFPNRGDRHAQRGRLLELMGVDLRAAFDRADKSGPEVDAMIHNLCVNELGQDVVPPTA